jgi:hypothetical protein
VRVHDVGATMDAVRLHRSVMEADRRHVEGNG